MTTRSRLAALALVLCGIHCSVGRPGRQVLMHFLADLMYSQLSNDALRGPRIRLLTPGQTSTLAGCLVNFLSLSLWSLNKMAPKASHSQILCLIRLLG